MVAARGQIRERRKTDWAPAQCDELNYHDRPSHADASVRRQVGLIKARPTDADAGASGAAWRRLDLIRLNSAMFDVRGDARAHVSG